MSIQNSSISGDGPVEDNQEDIFEVFVKREAAFFDESANRSKPFYNGRCMFSKEQQACMFEILKCAVCLEVPKGRPIKACEMGHHFCRSCHKKLKSCAICRGRLFDGRNFAVEELLSKMGDALGVARPVLPAPREAPKIPPGLFLCPHNCTRTISALSMLPHIRSQHKPQLVDNVRSNPHNGRFDYMFRVLYKENGVTTLSMQISDMGLMSVQVRFIDSSIRAHVQTLCPGTKSDLFRYRLTLAHQNSDFSVTDVPVSSFNAPSDAPAFYVPFTLLPELGSELTFYVYIWRLDDIDERFSDFKAEMLIPEDPVVFASDRTFRRNRNRLMRRSRNKKRLAVEKSENRYLELPKIKL